MALAEPVRLAFFTSSFHAFLLNGFILFASRLESDISFMYFLQYFLLLKLSPKALNGVKESQVRLTKRSFGSNQGHIQENRLSTR